ncbi:MAG: FUSC family protein [Erysipelotrichaceae bacterium]
MKKIIPPIGLRIIKSSIVVFLSLMTTYIRGNDCIPFYTAIAAIMSVQPTAKDAKYFGLGRAIGTFIGGFWGIVLLYINILLPAQHIIVHYLIVSLMIIPTIYTSIILKKPQSAFIACVTLISITINHITDTNPFLFAFNRMLDTFIGSLIGLAINYIALPKEQADN